MLFVNLKHGTRENDLIGKSIVVLLIQIFDRGVNILDRRGYDTFFELIIKVAEHRVGFSASGLSICKDCGVESSNKMLDHFFADRVVNLWLNGWVFENMVVGEEIIFTEDFFMIDDSYFFIEKVGGVLEFIGSEPDEGFDVKFRGLDLLLGNDVEGLVGLGLRTVSGTDIEGGFGVGLFEAEAI